MYYVVCGTLLKVAVAGAYLACCMYTLYVYKTCCTPCHRLYFPLLYSGHGGCG
jgi:hypothetical protein